MEVRTPNLSLDTKSVHTQLSTSFGKSILYPSLCHSYYRFGMYQVYDGERDHDSIVRWVYSKVKLDSTELTSCEELKSKLTDELTVTYFGKFEGDLFKRFSVAAKSHDKYNYFHVDSDCSKEHFGATEVPGLMITRNFDESPMHYDGEANEHSILFWMEVLSIPRVVDFSEEYVNTVFKQGRTSLVLFSNYP